MGGYLVEFMNEPGFVIQQRPYPPEWIFALDTPSFAPAPELWDWINKTFLNKDSKLFNEDHFTTLEHFVILKLP